MNSSSAILFEVLSRRRSRDRHNHLGTFEQPRQCDLQRSRVKLLRHFLDGIVCFSSLTERSPGEESDTVLLAVINDEVGFTISETVTVLYRNNRHDSAGALNVLAGHIGESYMTNLALFPQLGQRFHRSLEGDGIIGGMELMNIDSVNAQTLQTTLQRFREMFWACVVRPLARTWPLPSALGRDSRRASLPAAGSQARRLCLGEVPKFLPL